MQNERKDLESIQGVITGAQARVDEDGDIVFSISALGEFAGKTVTGTIDIYRFTPVWYNIMQGVLVWHGGNLAAAMQDLSNGLQGERFEFNPFEQ